MRATLPATLIPPLIFWACETTTPPVVTPPSDAGEVARDAETRDALGEADAETFADAADTPDAGEGYPDAADQPDAETDGGTPACAYPANPVEPMALGEVLWPYSWPAAINGAGDNFPLSLEQAHCATDPNIDWSRFGHFLFVSIPAW